MEGTQARQRAFDTIATELITRINFLLVLIRCRQREQQSRHD